MRIGSTLSRLSRYFPSTIATVATVMAHGYSAVTESWLDNYANKFAAAGQAFAMAPRASDFQPLRAKPSG